jgi:TonB-linked SusC/RagA family outer membrane protein
MMFSQTNKELGGAAIDGQSAYSAREDYNNEGYFGRLQYDYDQQYFLSASLRRDASSRFHPDHRWGTFWSVGGAWLMNKESFLKDVKWIDELKLKASYGSQGNDNINDYLYVDRYDIKNSAGQIGVEWAGKGTNDITWETNGNLNAGIEFQLFKRVQGSIEYYYRKTTDMLFQFGVSPSLGYSSYWANVGDMYNTGIETEFNVNIFKTKDFEWDVNLNFSTIKNRITKLHNDKKNTTVYGTDGKAWEGYVSGSFFITEDASIYSWYMKDYAGLNENGQATWWKNTFDENGNWTGREATATWSEADYYMTKETTVPDFYGGFGTTIKFRGFDFTANFTYQIGGKQFDSAYASFMTTPTDNHGGWNIHVDALNAWTPTNTGTDVPRWNYGDLNTGNTQTRFLTDASYLNLQNINLGYTLPKAFTQKFQVSSLRVYASAENVYYWSKRKGFDPRQSFSETANATRYSPMRTISGGITVTF